MITIDYLRELFYEKYGDTFFIKQPPEILVTLTRDEYKELNSDLISMTGQGILLLVDESDMTLANPEDILYTKINIHGVCEFIVQLGDKFSFELVSQDTKHGEEDL